MTETQFGTDAKELEKIFEMTDEKREKIAGIKNRLEMPSPDKKGDSRTVRVLYYTDKDKKTTLFKKVSGPKIKNVAIFLNVEELEAPGVQRDMPVSKTLYQTIDRELVNRGLIWDELPGKILMITAGYWKSAPRSKRSKTCPQCRGQGCSFCTVEGAGEDAGVITGMSPPTRYDAQIRETGAGVGVGTGGTKKPTEF